MCCSRFKTTLYSVTLFKVFNFIEFLYIFSDSKPMKSSRASLTSTVQLDSDDDGMADEYQDSDDGKFTQEGTFIGQSDTSNRAVWT